MYLTKSLQEENLFCKNQVKFLSKNLKFFLAPYINFLIRDKN